MSLILKCVPVMMTRRTFATAAVIVAVLLTAGDLLANDVTIAPFIEVRASASPVASLSAPLLIDRAAARRVGQVVVEPRVDAEEEGFPGDGVVQELSTPLHLGDLVDSHLAAGGMKSVIRIELAGASAARLRFADVPAGAVLWLAGSDDEEFIEFRPSVSASWGPTTNGRDVFIASEGLAQVTVSAVASVTAIGGNVTRDRERQPGERRQVKSDATSCLEDVACTPPATFAQLPEAMRAVAYLRIVRDGKTFVCSGALVNDASASRTPYFLTARHCVPDADAAASVEIIWDLRSTACGSNQMEKYHRSYGATLLVASARTDVALLRLNEAPPAGRVFLGIETRRLNAGDVVHRVSHAYGLAQTYASSVVTDGGASCGGALRPWFVYSEPQSGGIANGSSGAPMLVNGLYVTGQLLGLCGSDPNNPCAVYNDVVDGSIRESWPLLAEHLAPETIAGGGRRRAAGK